MRTIALLAAITMMHAVHAIPRPDLAVRQDGNDLRNESHIFHHLDRNQRTANRDRERIHSYDAERSGLAVVRRVSERPQRARVAARERRFMKSPDYSQGGGSGGGSNSQAASSAPDTMPTQPTQPPTTAEKESVSMGNP
ncbi:hypothetical protein L210DRAFT_3531220 [Boletus edulis BED1]|uniref:Uncharacterized protein n=1 Tax=Boletus edulis BED1 TaxID=1328754 RepID=A0AAD4C046_BOLED|nr:hypothetical protein L210DRAFT_3531220 [Boletus edulis BED1]